MEAMRSFPVVIDVVYALISIWKLNTIISSFLSLPPYFLSLPSLFSLFLPPSLFSVSSPLTPCFLPSVLYFSFSRRQKSSEKCLW